MENEYTEIDLMELLGIILKKWWLLTILAILAASTAFFVTDRYVDPVYKAKTSLFLGKETNSIGGIGISLSELQTFNQLIIDYKQLAQTRLVAEDVINELGLNMSVEIFRDNLSVSTIDESRLFTVSFKHTNKQLAADVANTLADRLIVVVSEYVEIENVRVIDRALVPDKPISPNKKMNAAIAGVLGIMVGLFIIFVMKLLDNTYKKEGDIERDLGVTVLGVIPKFKGEVRNGK